MAERPVFTVIGAGNGGFCATADLTLRGYEVRLCELPAFVDTIVPVRKSGGITIRGVAGEGFARPAMVTTDIESALEGANVVLVIVPAMGHKPVARACAAYLKPGQIVVLVPGCFGGVLEFRQELLSNGGGGDIILAETTSLMYAAKKEGDSGVWARGLKNNLPLAAFPACRTGEVLSWLKPAFPQMVRAKNVLETSFHNLNHIVHPAGMLMNMGFVEGKRLEEWYFYRDGYTPGTARIGHLLDNERMEVARSYNIKVISVVETLQRFYSHQGVSGDNLYELFRDSPVHNAALGPRTAKDRLLSEDIPYGLVPMVSFGRLAGVPTPVMDSIITLASIVNEIDYRRVGRTVESLGLSGMTPQAVLKYVSQSSADLSGESR